MYKIYSRKRFILKPFSTINSKKPSPQKTRQKKKLIILLTILTIIAIIIRAVLNYIEPIFEAMCE